MSNSDVLRVCNSAISRSCCLSGCLPGMGPFRYALVILTIGVVSTAPSIIDASTLSLTTNFNPETDLLSGGTLIKASNFGPGAAAAAVGGIPFDIDYSNTN